jgi:hypothetical protein
MMSIHINRFIDRLKAADARRQKDFSMSMTDARDLHADITKLLLAIQELQTTRSVVSGPTEIDVDGGSF